MDLCLFSVCVMICLIGTTHPSGNEHCLCSKIPVKSNTKNPLDTCTGNPTGFRYVCIDDYVRKVGTSNLLKCENGEWINPNLECILHPSLNTGPSEPRPSNRAAWTTAKPSTTTQLPNRSETSTGLQNKNSSESTSGGDKKPGTPGTKESTTAQYTPQSSTHSTVSTTETIPTQMDKHKSMVTGVEVGVTVVILTCSTIGLILFFYICRRRKRHIPISLEAEMEPMNGALAKVP